MKKFLGVVLLLCTVYCLPTERYEDKEQKLKDSTGFKVYTRDEWGGLPPTAKPPLTTPVNYVVIHHTYIPAACNTTEKCSASMRAMQNYHMSLGWGDIGYNFCLGSEGGVYVGRGFTTKGIHAGNANNQSVGICLIGDWRVELPPREALNNTKALIKQGIYLGYISPDYKLVGHMQVMSTECPGTRFMEELATWDHFDRTKHIDLSNKNVHT